MKTLVYDGLACGLGSPARTERSSSRRTRSSGPARRDGRSLSLEHDRLAAGVEAESFACDPEPQPLVEPRLLVVADSQCSETELRTTILRHLGGTGAVYLVVPVRVSELEFLADDEVDLERESRQSMRLTTGLLAQSGVAVTGSVGSDTPLESMVDALGSFPATHVLLATPPEGEGYWLERDLLAKAHHLTRVPVTQVILPSMIPVGSGSGEVVSPRRARPAGVHS